MKTFASTSKSILIQWLLTSPQMGKASSRRSSASSFSWCHSLWHPTQGFPVGSRLELEDIGFRWLFHIRLTSIGLPEYLMHLRHPTSFWGWCFRPRVLDLIHRDRELSLRRGAELQIRGLVQALAIPWRCSYHLWRYYSTILASGSECFPGIHHFSLMNIINYIIKVFFSYPARCLCIASPALHLELYSAKPSSRCKGHWLPLTIWSKCISLVLCMAVQCLNNVGTRPSQDEDGLWCRRVGRERIGWWLPGFAHPELLKKIQTKFICINKFSFTFCV